MRSGNPLFACVFLNILYDIAEGQVEKKEVSPKTMPCILFQPKLVPGRAFENFSNKTKKPPEHLGQPKLNEPSSRLLFFVLFRCCF